MCHASCATPYEQDFWSDLNKDRPEINTKRVILDYAFDVRCVALGLSCVLIGFVSPKISLFLDRYINKTRVVILVSKVRQIASKLV